MCEEDDPCPETSRRETNLDAPFSLGISSTKYGGSISTYRGPKLPARPGSQSSRTTASQLLHSKVGESLRYVEYGLCSNGSAIWIGLFSAALLR